MSAVLGNGALRCSDLPLLSLRVGGGTGISSEVAAWVIDKKDTQSEVEMKRPWHSFWRKGPSVPGLEQSATSVKIPEKKKVNAAARRERITEELIELERMTQVLKREIVLESGELNPIVIAAIKYRLTRARDIRYKTSLLRAELDRIEAKTATKGEPKHSEDGREKIPQTVVETVAQVMKEISFSNRTERVFFEKALEDFASSRTGDRLDAIKALRTGKFQAVLPLFRAGLESGSDMVRAECLLALADMRNPCGEDKLIHYMESSSHRLRVAALRCLFNTGSSHTLGACLGSLADMNSEVRLYDVEFLGLMKSVQTAPVLTILLRDEDVDVRVATAQSLGMLRSEQAVYSLIRSLMDGDVSVRRAAKAALTRTLSLSIDIDVIPDARALSSAVETLLTWWAIARTKGPPWLAPLPGGCPEIPISKSETIREDLPRIGYIPIRDRGREST